MGGRGRPSDQPDRTVQSAESNQASFDPPADRQLLRITNVYATRATTTAMDGGEDPTQHLRLGRLDLYYRVSSAQIAQVVDHRRIEPAELRFTRWEKRELVRSVTSWLFAVPNGQLVAALTLDVECDLLDVIELLEDCYYGDVTVGAQPLGAALLRAPVTGPKKEIEPELPELLPERHQLLFASHQLAAAGQRPLFNDSGFDEDTAQRIVYRADLPYRPEHSSIVYPPELNRRPSAAAAMGPYVSLLAGQQDYVENAALLSAVQGVASAARLRQVRAEAYELVRELDAAPARGLSLPERRRRLERAADALGRMEVDLSRGVEAAADIDLLVPSLRVSNFHRTLFDCMSLTTQATTVARMIARLERAIGAELTSLASIDRRADQQRRLRWTIAAGFISTVAVPVTLVLAFFGINAQEVDAGVSMFDSRYLPIYLLTALVILVTVTLFTGLHIQHRIRNGNHEDQPRTERFERNGRNGR